ncbi:hypothetical protein [Pelomonas sp. Root1237]|uniref:hypothetical protein n=1 Tax=Pelomonas sp. Root1237 TaxID=1736434 RepID=UPI0012F914BC|nr:hypothetical protein [Pelomonas sp. Root1237]
MRGLSLFLGHQLDSMTGDFRDGSVTCLIATTRTRLLEHCESYGWTAAHLPGIKPTSCVVIRKPNMQPELWVRSRYRGYRKAFRLFLSEWGGIGDDGIPHNLQVDHLHPASRFTPKNDHYFVRLALIERGVNASYGAGFERLLYERERERALSGGVHMDWMAYLKVRGIRLPAKTAGKAVWKAWSWQCAKSLGPEGFDPVFTYVGLTTMLNLAFLNIWRPLPPDDAFRPEVEAHPSYPCAPQLAEV